MGKSRVELHFVADHSMLMVPNTDGDGTVVGAVIDAVTGADISDATLEIRSGWNNTSIGEVIDTISTDEDGEYTITLPRGNYTIVATKDGYISNYFNVAVVTARTIKYTTLSPVEQEEEGIYRVVLTWGAEPRDLDSHLTSENYHVYYSRSSCDYAWLDVDDTSAYGPETITILSLADLGGFKYSVHDYTNSYFEGYYESDDEPKFLSYSGATVQVYKDGQLIKTYRVPRNKVGTTWNVFSIDENGVITDINSFEYNAFSSYVGN